MSTDPHLIHPIPPLTFPSPTFLSNKTTLTSSSFLTPARKRRKKEKERERVNGGREERKSREGE
ncbi:hypothetical protein Syun_012583 [Stephania yunnanensis]|uniref:Uncharacterized protein n=1 Tax=Stephania yunnanensis TaxID=152371 RepID=A0AAP0PFG3_9MAGN